MNEENDRVMPPSNSSDAEALREYGRQLAMDCLMADLEGPKVVGFPARNWNRRAWISASAASVAAMAGFAVWKFGRGETTGGGGLVTLDPRWILVAAAGAEYRIIAANHIELTKGELRLTSREPAKLLVEAPNAKATASGTDFFIGHHELVDSKQNIRTMNKKTMTRLLVLTGSVALATGQGTEIAGPNESVVAQADLPPEKILVRANSEFAFDLYAELAKSNEGGNLFFSPYSVSNALLMVAEGARGKTALEMGQVLGFPKALLRTGDEGQSIPWEMSVMRAGQARLNELMGGGDVESSEQVKLKSEEAELSKQWQELKAKQAKAEEARDWGLTSQIAFEGAAIVGRLNEVRGRIDTLTLKVANAVWADRSMDILEPWRKTVSGTYGAGAIEAADFSNQFEIERGRINTWVEEQTEGRIKDVFPKGAINNLTRMVLANAIYFKGDWLTPFPEEETSEETFTLGSGSEVKVPLMSKSGDQSARYAAFNADGDFFITPKMVPYSGVKPQTYPGKDGFAMVEMPYQGGDISMVVIAPNDSSGLASLEKRLTRSNLEQWINALDRRAVHIALPKFKMEKSYSLNKVLATMGMPLAFDSDKADFSGISQEKFFIGAIAHKSFIEVSEKGTEAAAATGLSWVENSIPREVPFTPAFEADRPFVYLIRDQKSGAILFLGRVLNPNH